MRSIGDKILSNRFSGKLCVWLIVFASFYYPIGAFFILTLGVPSTPVNIAVRAGAAGLGLYLFLLALINNKKRLKIPLAAWFVFLFWFVYTIRLVYDMNIAGVTWASKPNSLVYGFAFGNILIPMLAIINWYKFFTIADIVKLCYKFFVLANILIFIILVQQNGGFNLNLFLTRASAMGANEEVSELVLNPIAIGRYGGLLAVAALYYVLVIKEAKIWVHIPLFLFGLIMLTLGASRGPFLSTVATFLVVLFYRFRISYSKIINFLKLILIVVVIAFTVNKSMGDTVSFDDFQMFQRLSRLLENRQNNKIEARDLSWASAWQDFLDSPIVGKQFVGTHDRFYPHNIMLEIPMATGIVGSLCFLCFFIPLIFKIIMSYWNRDHDYLFLSIIFVPILIGRLFSGALFLSIDLWLLIVVAVTFKVQPKAKVVHVRESKIIPPKQFEYNSIT